MEHVEDIHWDVIIAGTGLPQSLLALALSRSGLKVLHLDKNTYYGGSAAALNLQDAVDWVESVRAEDSNYNPFSSASVVKSSTPSNGLDAQSSSPTALGPPRRYNLMLSPSTILARSALLSAVVSARIEQQLEFVAQGGTWILSGPIEVFDDTGTPNTRIASESLQTHDTSLKKVPNSREDIVSDTSLDLKSKRSISKFLRFITDLHGDSQREVWANYEDRPFGDLLAEKFGMAEELRLPLHALARTANAPNNTQTKWALRRIEQQLQSVNVLGAGFNAVIPKYGGLAEIVQAACRAQAVGGGVYMLGHRIASVEERAEGDNFKLKVNLDNGNQLKTRWLMSDVGNMPKAALPDVNRAPSCSCSVSVISSALPQLLEKATEDGTEPAGATVWVPTDDGSPPVQIIAHSSVTDECPTDQCVLYSSTNESEAFHKLEMAVNALIASIDASVRVLWRLQYEHQALRVPDNTGLPENAIIFDEPESDIIFDDGVLDSVKSAWKKVLGLENGEGEFMRFPPRSGEEAVEDDTS